MPRLLGEESGEGAHLVTLPIADILDRARIGREAVRELCARLSDEELRAEIERIGEQADLPMYRGARQARAALETVRDERSLAAAIATLPEDRR